MTDTATDDVARIVRQLGVLRVLRGMTQQQVAEILDVNIWQVSIWERGRQLPISVNLARYARALGKRLVLVDDIEQTAKACLTPDDPSLPDEPVTDAERVSAAMDKAAEAAGEDVVL